MKISQQSCFQYPTSNIQGGGVELRMWALMQELSKFDSLLALLLSVSSVAPLLQTHWGKGVSFGVLPAFCPFWSSEWMSAEKSLQVGVDSSCVCSSQGCCTLMLVHFCPFTVCYKLLAEFFLF